MKKFRLVILFVSLFSLNLYASGVVIQSPQAELCYTKRIVPQPYDVVFNAMKRYLMSANFLLKTGDKESKFLYTEGMIVVDDKHYEVKLSVNFKTKFLSGKEFTAVSVVANYKMIEESSTMESMQLGVITFPIPTPWNREFRLKESDNIKDPDFFRAFYYGFYKTLYQEEIDNFGTQKKEEKQEKKEETTKKVEEGLF